MKWMFACGDADETRDYPRGTDADEVMSDAIDWAQEGDWGEGFAYVDVSIAAWRKGKWDWIREERIQVGEEPEAPECRDERGHQWVAPYEAVGGLKENPGVWVVQGNRFEYVSICSRCGIYRHEIDGDDIMIADVIKYEEASEKSIEWVRIYGDGPKDEDGEDEELEGCIG